jgi:hypothetical protein
MKVLLLAVLSFSLSVPASCDAQKRGNVGNSNQPGRTGTSGNGQPGKPRDDAAARDLQTLAQGQHSPVSNAFIYVARDAETYNALRRMVASLPEQNEEFFKSNQVVAAFLGERRSGGYGVRFTLDGNGALRVEESTPPKGSMTIQVITYPFTVAAVPVGNQEPLALEVGKAWQAMTRPFQVSQGEFTMSGGIAGRSQKFNITGSIGVMREGELATLLFNLQSKDGAKPRLLKEVASGVVQRDGRLSIARMSAGSFVDRPADALRAVGTFTENETSLLLKLESIPGRVADGFNGTGALNARTSSPAPAKNKTSREDVPQ